ncbi:TadE/TadG family type IV pilus assembly protein [Spongiactinospora sp. TRM90649]|uniref:TadE/TadG family type IV pilus assembly protein n=1 Tax=Spongiactinospora sp. TRM90649 TaxID=3031114 RepID=UPI0023F77DD4|nr:TadE/TadG family type IV pilus assembly protein [Spongiactinospora sp. TRM90649]MDF5759051.1 TadE/TadG family type IV pilus assembly protein [Spongiactinospora sp. TRM90649]
MSRGEQGSATLETALVYPVVLLLVLLAVNAALWFHARNIALSAAQEGLRSARVHGAALSAGQVAAERFIQQTAGSFLTSAQVRVQRRANTVEVAISGEAISLVPVLSLGVHQVARAPVERWTSE